MFMLFFGVAAGCFLAALHNGGKNQSLATFLGAAILVSLTLAGFYSPNS